MSLAAFSIKWFIVYYIAAGTFFLVIGAGLLVKPAAVKQYLLRKAEVESPPPLIRNLVKYFFIFTLPCLILSFFSPSWIELLFSLWSLFMVYEVGIQLVRWEQSRHLILENRKQLSGFIRFAGAIMVAVSFVIYSLDLLLINRTAL